MESIDILTGQHVTIAYKPASAFERGFATFLDWIIQGLYLLFISIVFGDVMYWMNNAMQITIALLLWAPVGFYNFLFEGVLFHCQTPGKMIMKLKVTTSDGSAVSLGNHFLRWILRPVDFFPFLGALGMFVMLYNKRGQRIGDMAADTVVVKTSGKIDIGIEYYDFDENYVPVYPQAVELSVLQAARIMNYLDLPEKHHEERIEELALKVIKVLKIEDRHAPNRLLLKQVMKDYNYCTSLGI